MIYIAHGFFTVSPGASISVANKEALYCAIGRCCQRLKGEIHFEDWVNQILTAEVQLPAESDPLCVTMYLIWVLALTLVIACFY